MKTHVLALLFCFPALLFAGGSEEVVLKKARINLHDQASLQRGAAYFMNYCSGCHSLQYARYNLVAKDIGIVDQQGEVNQKLVKDNLIFTRVKVGDNINTAMNAELAAKWFGVPPPDLTLEARYRGPNWIYTYLNSFYEDQTRPWGTNNHLLHNVAMPNVLQALQGDVYPIIKGKMLAMMTEENANQTIEALTWVQNGRMMPKEFETMTNDIVNFLTYVAEPAKLHRYYLGMAVLFFLLVFGVFAYWLKKVFWQDL